MSTPSPRISTPDSHPATPTAVDSQRPDNRSESSSPIARKAAGSASCREVQEVSSRSTMDYFLKTPVMVAPERIESKGADIPKTAIIQTTLKRGATGQRGRLQKKMDTDWKGPSFDGRVLSDVLSVNLEVFVGGFGIAMWAGVALAAEISFTVPQCFSSNIQVRNTSRSVSRGGALGARSRANMTTSGGIYPTGRVSVDRDATAMTTRLLESGESAGSLGRGDIQNGLSSGFLAPIQHAVLPIFPSCPAHVPPLRERIRSLSPRRDAAHPHQGDQLRDSGGSPGKRRKAFQLMLLLPKCMLSTALPRACISLEAVSGDETDL
ncbi:hypothetical protein MKZ38_007803 [Zalerion maritima]|uniref:Uncharacterized protein n=1 Tax=Zalerion maritima TaxID=339359 RepID=A0AAD5RLX0_9PEZI|nr:hypothetical protein MKZ38_007803 [Zalerion maritima]